MNIFDEIMNTCIECGDSFYKLHSNNTEKCYECRNKGGMNKVYCKNCKVDDTIRNYILYSNNHKEYEINDIFYCDIEKSLNTYIDFYEP
jgi:hypothetical protein